MVVNLNYGFDSMDGNKDGEFPLVESISTS